MAVACEGALPLHTPVRQCAEPAHGRMLGRSQGVMFLQVCSTRRVNESMEAWRCYVAARHVVTHHVHAPRCRMHGSWSALQRLCCDGPRRLAPCHHRVSVRGLRRSVAPTHITCVLGRITLRNLHTAASKTTVKGRQPPCRFCKGGTIGIASGSLVRVATPMVPRTSCARTRFCLRFIWGWGKHGMRGPAHAGTVKAVRRPPTPLARPTRRDTHILRLAMRISTADGVVDRRGLSPSRARKPRRTHAVPQRAPKRKQDIGCAGRTSPCTVDGSSTYRGCLGRGGEHGR